VVAASGAADSTLDAGGWLKMALSDPVESSGLIAQNPAAHDRQS
jgi:hypothetical protein